MAGTVRKKREIRSFLTRIMLYYIKTFSTTQSGEFAMGGFFGVVSKDDCVDDLFYGVDYHSHLGTVRGGMAVTNSYGSIIRSIHDISNEMFRSKFGPDL
jgi:hypothetical protein